MKTTFSRLFAMITALLLLCLLITGISFRFLMLSSLENEKKQTLQADAEAIAELARAYSETGSPAANWDFRLSLSLFTETGDAEALLCDESGCVQLCSCSQFSCEHLGKTVDAGYLAEIDEKQKVSDSGLLGGIYDDERYFIGAPVLNAQTGETTGYVFVAAPMTEVREFLSRSSTLFFYTAIAVLLLSLGAATILSRSQVKPLAQMAEAARRFGHGELDIRIESSKGNTREINDLATAFNSMADSLEQSEKQRKEFIANVSHELKTPMTTIGGYIDGMLDGTIPREKQQHYMQIVSSEVRRLSRLVRNMLDISRLQAVGVEESRKTRFDLGMELGDVLITFEQKINAKRLQVSVDLPERPVWVRAEKDSVTQVIYNLLDNAIKFCPQGGRLSLNLTVQGNRAETAIRNNGPDIPADELPFLFDRFHKADKSRSSDREGWGLGLYIAKTIVNAHGGDIRAESGNGETGFFFTLPVQK